MVEGRVREEGSAVESGDVPQDDRRADEDELVEEELVRGCEDLEDEVKERVDVALMVVVEELRSHVLVEEPEDGSHR